MLFYLYRGLISCCSIYKEAWYHVIRVLPRYLPMGWYRCGTSVLTHVDNWRYYLKICYNVILRPSKLTLLVFIDNVIMYVMSHWTINVSGLILTISRGEIKRKRVQLILTISLDDIKGNMYDWYWQYHLVRSTETSTIDTDNITWWDQRKHVQLILTISLGEIKGNMYNWYGQYHLVRSKETCIICR